MIHITKTTGEVEQFEEEKFFDSMRNAGAEHSLAEEVFRMVRLDKHNLQTTNALHIATEQALLQHNELALAARYNLKRSIVDLGPSGYPFEQFMGHVFAAYGYKAKTNQLIKGKCVTHEVDVIAEQDGMRYMVECKHHHYPGAKTNIRVALYVYARFLDILHTWTEVDGIEDSRCRPFLVTNTKLTTDAIAYAECMNMRVLAWHYPKNKGLNELIEQKKLYPITALPGMNTKFGKKLVEQKMVLASDILDHTSEQLQRKAKMPAKLANHLLASANALLNE